LTDLLIEAEPQSTAPICDDPWVDRMALRVLGAIPGMGRRGVSSTVKRAVHGSSWTLIGYAGTQVVRLASNILLARFLLGPEAYGIVALVNVFLGGLEMLSDLGVGMDVIQHPRGDDRSFINTAFLIQAVRGLILWLVIIAFAHPFATFYKQPAVFWLIVVGGSSTLVRGFTSGSIWTMSRHVQLRRLTILTLVGEFAGFVVSLVWALVSPSAWSLVIGRTAVAVVFVAGSHLLSEYAISTAWDRSAAKDILLFGAGIFVSTSTYFLAGEAERLVVAKFITIIELGCFSLALTISSAATAGLKQIVTQVFFTLVAKALRENIVVARRQYEIVRYFLLVVSVVLGITFLIGGPLIVKILLGPKYLMAGWILQLMGVRSALELFTMLTASMLFAVGTSKYAALANISKLIFLAVGLTISFGWFGFTQALWVLAIAPMANYIPYVIGLRRLVKPVFKTEMVCFAGFVLTISITSLFVLAFRR
jgi:O-antigen/teichoic acid export membrane protein